MPVQPSCPAARRSAWRSPGLSLPVRTSCSPMNPPAPEATANGNAVLDILRAMADGESRAVVMVTHDLEAAARADRVFVMRDGKIVHMMTRPASREILTAMEAVGERDTDEGAMLR